MFTVLGEALLDMVQPAPGDTYRARPAGGPLNIAIGLRRLAHPVAMMARFSAGPLGGRIRGYAEANRLDLSASVSTDAQATLAFATIDAAGRAAYDFYVRGTADWGWTADELARLPSDSAAVHTGSLAALLDPGAPIIAGWWERLANDAGVLLSYDPNIRPSLTDDRRTVVRQVERMVAASHLVKASDEDVRWLYPDREPAETLQRWARTGPFMVVLTRGPDGCLAATVDGRCLEIPAPKVDVVDTIGAGDAFQAGLLSGLADTGRLARDALRDCSDDDLGRVLHQALVVAALTCQRAGADPPTRAEFEAARQPPMAAVPELAESEGQP